MNSNHFHVGAWLLGVLFAASVPLACGNDGQASTSCEDAGFQQPDGAPVCLFPEVTWEPTEIPTGQATDYSWWIPTYCSAGDDLQLSCPDVLPELACLWVYKLGGADAWLHAESGSPASLSPPLLCVSCPNPTGALETCTCPEGGFRDVLRGIWAPCNVLMVPDAAGPRVIRSLAELAATYAPVETAGEALAFSEIAVAGVRHRFFDLACGSGTETCYRNFPVFWGEPSDFLGCVDPVVTATWVEPLDEDWLVHTYREPEGQGCHDVQRERVDILVTRAGDVEVLDASPECYQAMLCVD